MSNAIAILVALLVGACGVAVALFTRLRAESARADSLQRQGDVDRLRVVTEADRRESAEAAAAVHTASIAGIDLERAETLAVLAESRRAIDAEPSTAELMKQSGE